MLKLFPVCRRCRDLEDEVEALKRKLAQEQDKRLTARLVQLHHERKSPSEATWSETLHRLERVLRDYLRSVPRAQREWRVPGSQDLRAVRSALDSLVGLEGLQQAQQAEFLQRLARELDRAFPGNILTESLTSKAKLTELVEQILAQPNG